MEKAREHQRIEYRVASDLTPGGAYGETILELDQEELRSRTADGLATVALPRRQVRCVACRDYVGNGEMEAWLEDGRRVPLIRYTKSLSDRFAEAEDSINQILGGSLAEEQRRGQARPPDNSGRSAFSYRCPNCSYPLRYQGDACPRCVNIKSVLLRLTRYLGPYWREALLGLLLALLLAAIQMAPGVLLQRLIDGPLRLPSVPSPADLELLSELPEEQWFDSAAARQYYLEHENSIELSVLSGSGTHGRITRRDLELFLADRPAFASAEAQNLAYDNLLRSRQMAGVEAPIAREQVAAYLEALQDTTISAEARLWAFHLGVDLHAVAEPDGPPVGRADVIEAMRPTRVRRVAGLVSALLLAFVMRSVMIWGRANIMGGLGAKLMHDIRGHLYRALQRLSLSFYDQEHSGHIMSRVNEDTNVLRNFVATGFQQVIVDVLTILVLSVVMISFHWQLALFTLLPMPVIAFGTFVFARKARGIYRRIRRKAANLLKTVQETVSGVYVVKSFAQEDREIAAFGVDNRAHRDTTVESVRLLSIFQPSMVFLTGIGMLIIYSYGSWLVVDGTLSVGVLVMFNAFLAQFYAPVQQLSHLTDTFQRAAVSAERIFNIVDAPTEVEDSDQAVPLTEVRGEISIEHLDFVYEKGERVLHNINLQVRPGEVIGLVGATGAGKSTMVKLLARFYDPSAGRILLDGWDLRQLQMRSLRRNIGMVLQETFLFTGSLRDNISYANPEAGLDDIVAAARAANAHDFIMNLPDAYDTLVGERGVGLSGGEKQRISIARAILKNPAILILDEATSSVDTATEAMIQEALERLMRGRTAFVIAHRLSTLQNADRLVVLEQGKIAEVGTHQELLSKPDGIYRNLVEIQDLLSGKRKQNTLEPSGPGR